MKQRKSKSLGKKVQPLMLSMLRAQGIEAQVILVRVEEKSTIAETQVEMVGSNTAACLIAC